MLLVLVTGFVIQGHNCELNDRTVTIWLWEILATSSSNHYEILTETPFNSNFSHK